MAERLAMSMIDGDFCPLVEGETEGEQLRFCGIWSKNRMEWSTTLLACMHVKVVPVGFYEAMSEDQIDFILNQTGISTMFMSAALLPKMIQLKKNGLAAGITNIVLMNDEETDDCEQLRSESMRVVLWQSLVEDKGLNIELQMPDKDDYMCFCYTSGTTGDPKGVKMTHYMVMTAVNKPEPFHGLYGAGDSYLSYLPVAHSYETLIFTECIYRGMR